MKIFALLYALTASQAMAQDNLEVDSMLSILAKPKLAMQVEFNSIKTIEKCLG